MDIEAQQSQWAKSTQSRIEIFLDSYLIRSPIAAVRSSSQRLILSLFKKGNEEQRLRVMSLLNTRCQNLTWMGKASEEFLGLVKNIFSSTTDYADHKREIIKKIFSNLQIIHRNVISNSNYEFYSFASNLIDFGNQQFKPYLLQANGCQYCFGCSEPKSEPFKLENCLQTVKIFTNKLEYVFKRVYEVKDLTISLKSNSRMKGVTAYYISASKEFKKIGNRYKPGETISISGVTLQGLFFQFDMSYIGHKKRVQCIFCDNIDDLNGVCGVCSKRSDMIEINGSFRAIGADQQLISEQLCQDYQKIQESISAIKNLHSKMESKQKISLNFKLDEMVQVYQRIVNNLRMLHQKNPSKLKAKEDQNCFSCNYYEVVNIVRFLKQIMKKTENIPFEAQEMTNFKQVLRDCLCGNQIQSLKLNLLQTLAAFIVNGQKANYKEEFDNRKNRFVSELIAKVLIALKEKRNAGQSIDEQLMEIREYLFQKSRDLKIEEKIIIFTCYFLDWQFLSLVLTNSFSHTNEVNRLTMDQFSQLSALMDFDLSEVFNLNLTNYLKAFLKIMPANILPSASLDISDCEFLQYVDNKIPEIDTAKIEQSIICCPNPMIKLDMFASLPILISQLPVHESMKVMNSLFPFRSAWNLNIMKACKKFDAKLAELPAEQQIATCLEGYCKSKEYLYIHKIYKLLVPQRMQFVIRFQAPLNEIEVNNIEYPYLPIREVKSEDLQGDTIKALHDWVYAELAKMNQAMPLDIIVEKNIIDNMDLPIELVYQNICENKSKRKIGDKEYEFFRVIYRIQGIMGEPKQRGIGNLRDQRLETCISYASYFLNKFSDEFSKKIGLDVLIEILQQVKPGSDNEDKRVLLFEILSTLSMKESICKKIVEGQYGDSIINATVRLMSFQNQKDAKITNFLLQLSSKVIDEANKEMINLRKGSAGEYRRMSGGVESELNVASSDSKEKVMYVRDKIIECEQTYQNTGNVLYRDISRKLIKLLPFCSKDETESSQLLFNFFELSKWSMKHPSKLDNLFVFMESLSQSYMTFKCIAREKGVTEEIIKTITSAIRKEGKEQIDEKKLAVNKSLTQSALLLLCALIQGDQSLQAQLFQTQVFHNVYEISLIPPKRAVEINAGKIPEICYKIVKYLSEGKIIHQAIHEFLEEKKRIEKEKKEPKKNKKWEMMKNKQKLTLGKRMEEEGEEGEKDLIVCSSCQEGYSRKKQILGLYIYSTKSEIPFQNNWWKDSRRQPSFTSTTYFTAIHFECHNKAYEADQKIPRSEWDGALIRNMDVLCNSWIPFKGPKTTVDEFSRVERKYFERNKNGNYWNVVNDLFGLIEKLSTEFDFATESKGSSASHNCRLIPILIAFASHLIERGGGCASIEEGVSQLMDSPPRKMSTLNYLVCYAAFVCPYDWFQKHKPQFLKWILALHEQEGAPQKGFEGVKPHLLFLKIVEQIFEIIHKPVQALNEGGSSQLKVYKQLEAYIAGNLQTVVHEFEKLSERYKAKYIKWTKVEEMQI